MASVKAKKKVVELDEEQALALDLGNALGRYIKYIQITTPVAELDKPRRLLSASEFLDDLGGRTEDQEVGQRIKVKRESLRMRQDDLASRVEISQSELSKLENGEKVLSVSRAEKIASVLKVKAHWLIDGK